MDGYVGGLVVSEYRWHPSEELTKELHAFIEIHLVVSIIIFSSVVVYAAPWDPSKNRVWLYLMIPAWIVVEILSARQNYSFWRYTMAVRNTVYRVIACDRSLAINSVERMLSEMEFRFTRLSAAGRLPKNLPQFIEVFAVAQPHLIIALVEGKRGKHPRMMLFLGPRDPENTDSILRIGKRIDAVFPPDRVRQSVPSGIAS